MSELDDTQNTITESQGMLAESLISIVRSRKLRAKSTMLIPNNRNISAFWTGDSRRNEQRIFKTSACGKFLLVLMGFWEEFWKAFQKVLFVGSKTGSQFYVNKIITKINSVEISVKIKYLFSIHYIYFTIIYIMITTQINLSIFVLFSLATLLKMR